MGTNENLETLSLENPPPHDLDVETCLIASCVLSISAREIIIGMISDSDFYRTQHVKIFSALKKIVDRQENPDLVPLVAELRTSGELENVGGAAYVASILSSDTAPNPEQYARRLKSLSVSRRLLEYCNAVSKRCYNGQDSENILTAARDKLENIANTGIGTEFDTTADLIPGYFDRLEKLKIGKAEGLDTGFFDIDNILQGLQGGNLIVLAGRPSMGKTALMVNLSINFGARGYRQAVFSLEMSKKLYLDRLIAAKSEVDYQRLRRVSLSQEDWLAIHDAGSSIAEYPIALSSKPKLHYNDICNMCRQLKRKSGLDVVLIDYLGFIRGTQKSGKQRYQEIGEITKALKNLAKELDIPIILLCQLNRELENRKDKRPQLHDMRESGEIEQDADIVLSIYRDAFYDKSPENKLKDIAEIFVLKNRHGPTGSVQLGFEAAIMKFRNLDDSSYEDRYEKM